MLKMTSLSDHDYVQVIMPSLGLCNENSKQLILIYQIISLRTRGDISLFQM